jgi:septal ring factor EnvC (AmiA/AmiB activator)
MGPDDTNADPTVEEKEAELEQLRAALAETDEKSKEHEELAALVAQVEADVVAAKDAAAAASTPEKKPAAKKAAAAKKAPARPSAALEPATPPVAPYLSELGGNYHEPTTPAVVADADDRKGYAVADADAGATHIAFEDGSTYDVDEGRIADRK